MNLRIHTLLFLLITGVYTFGQNLITNGDFESSCTGWSNVAASPGAAVFTCPNTADKHAGVNSLRANVSAIGTNAWDVQTLGPTFSVSTGTAYTLTFWARAAVAGSRTRVVIQNTTYAASDFTLTTAWAQYSMSFTPTESSLSVKMHYFQTGDFYFDDFVINGPVVNNNGPLAKCKGKYMGNIFQYSASGGINYNRYWNQVTSENGSKWGSIEGSQGVYNWTANDYAYNWAKNNNGLFKFHALVWGAQAPSYVSTASTATLTNSVRNFIAACSTHHAPMGGLNFIDVFNEPVNTALPGNLKAALTAGYRAEPANAADLNNPYGWVIWPFQLARKHFPNATLLINEYNIEMNWNNVIVPYIEMVKAVKNAPNLTDGRKNLIDGIGLQCHGINSLTATSFKSTLDRLWNETGVEIHITEFDATANPNEAKQRDVYATLVPVAWEHPHVAGITFWGYVQGTTWINGNGVSGASGTDSGIIYANGGERPAMTWLKSYMASRPDLPCCPAPAPFASCGSNASPTVSITAPLNNASYTAPASISISANAADSDGSVTKVDFFNGTTLIGSDATSPYSISWANVAAGTYSITARATDNAGAVTTSAAIAVVVSAAPNVAPTVSITAPLNNASYTAPASISISANAADSDGSVTKVDFYNGTTLIGSDATSPYSISWANVAAGTYSITARATDNAGAVTTSAAVTVTVAPGVPNVAPTVSISAPLNNATFTAPASIAISATAADSDGSVTKVDFYNGTTLIGTDATAPYSISWTNVAAGTYSITARATDNAGAVTTSAAITVVVNPAPNIAPTVSITAPLNNASFTAPASITINANAADSDGSVAKVDFYNGTTLIGTDATSPYSVVWANVAAGTYSITARATDNAGAVASSAIVTLVVNPPSTANIIGPDCGTRNTTLTFELNSSRRTNATSYNWWYTGSAQSTSFSPSTPYRSTVQTGPYFSSGQLCVGINYSVSPWYASYCKTIAVCAGAREGENTQAEEIETALVFPNPSQQEFQVRLSGELAGIQVSNSLGEIIYANHSVNSSGTITVGSDWGAGVYVCVLTYSDGRIEQHKMFKVK